jgi:hypothetical protein
MEENTYKTLAKIGSFGITWVILEQMYKLFYTPIKVIGFDINKWGIFLNEIIKDPEFLMLIVYPLILITLFILIALPLWYFGWKKKDVSN